MRICIMSSDSRINFDESIPDMIRRLEMEHKEFESQLTEVETNIEDNSIIRAAEIIKGLQQNNSSCSGGRGKTHASYHAQRKRRVGGINQHYTRTQLGNEFS